MNDDMELKDDMDNSLTSEKEKEGERGSFSEKCKIELVGCAMQNTEISQCIKSRTFLIDAVKRKHKSRTSVWESFGNIVMGPNIIIKNKVACLTCLSVLNYKYQWGTSNLIYHTRGCEIRSNSSKEQLSKQDLDGIKKAVRSEVVRFVCQDLRSFNTNSGVGFINLADRLIELGHQFLESVTANEK